MLGVGRPGRQVQGKPRSHRRSLSNQSVTHPGRLRRCNISITVLNMLIECAPTESRERKVVPLVCWSPLASNAKLENAVLESGWGRPFSISIKTHRIIHSREEADHLSEDWKWEAVRVLVEIRGDSRAWSYRRRGTPCVEPTSLVCLGLLASAVDDRMSRVFAISRDAADWISAIQQVDGSLPVSPSLKTPGWSTPYALLLWNRLTGYEPARQRARAWLLRDEKVARPVREDSEKILGHDPTLLGWPWVDGTHPWIEPTAMAILALCRDGQGDHPRVKEGIRLILDRALDHGGWNCGNKTVFGRELRPLPGPTGMALLALAAHGDRSPAISRALDYLLATLPSVRAPVSLGWGVLALRAHHACPAQSDQWLAEAFETIRLRPESTVSLALLLLAAGADESCLITPRIISGHSR